MRPGRAARLGAVGVACGAVLVSAFAATNTVAGSRAERDVSGITVDAKKPQPACNAFVVTTIFSGANPSGGPGNDLVLGTAAANTMSGNAGRDCLVGGGGNDIIRGNGGNDVCIGGPGVDTFFSCETQIQ
jgi:Ca2+-binding RTX toxin-like protein